MNKEFKVGQRVWSKEYKELATVIDDSYFETCRIKFDDGEEHSVFNIDLHQTADDMFEELGYSTVSEDSSYIIYNYHNYEDEYITELRIDKEKNKYKLTNFTNNNQAFSAWGDKLLHLALHQKMIELGRIE